MTRVWITCIVTWTLLAGAGARESRGRFDSQPWWDSWHIDGVEHMVYGAENGGLGCSLDEIPVSTARLTTVSSLNHIAINNSPEIEAVDNLFHIIPVEVHHATWNIHNSDSFWVQTTFAVNVKISSVTLSYWQIHRLIARQRDGARAQKQEARQRAKLAVLDFHT